MNREMAPSGQTVTSRKGPAPRFDARGHSARSRAPIRIVALVLAALTLSGCAGPRCQPGAGEAMRVYTLYFGRSVAGRAAVSDREWRDFRDQVITSALPNGYTVLDGQGAWMNPRSHATIIEATKVLVVALPESGGDLGSINRIRSAWQRRFHQYAVGMTVQSPCGSFLPAEAPP